MSAGEIVAIVNPLSGVGASAGVAEQRVALLNDQFRAASVRGRVHLTERRRHAYELATAAVQNGAPLVIAWGGDGTINEIASALAGSATPIGIIPAGSGNGFANELQIPRDPRAAIKLALSGSGAPIDAGQIDGRFFFNIAGIGIDAVIAEQFNARELGRRGMGPYVQIGLREAFRYKGLRYRIVLDGEEMVSDAMLIAFANGREYGNRIRLAPNAKMDDGKLEAIVVSDRSPLARLWSCRHLAFGSIERAPGLLIRPIESATVETDGDIVYHLDGEIGRARRSVTVKVLPGALIVKVPWLK